METRDITVNRDYQRSDKVWPDAAKSFLIESILLGFPVPKFYHHSITNVKTKRTSAEIIDGQQRSTVIFDYYNDKFALSPKLDTEAVRGRRYSELDEEWQAKFLSYLLSIDLFLGIDDTDVQQIFRRMNSYTVPLNPEELRHATFQGDFKWFMAAKADEHEELLLDYGILTRKAVIRMLDLKLLTEVTHAFDLGIKTTNKRSLDALYAKYDRNFPHEQAYGDMLDFAFGNMTDLDALDHTNLAKPYFVYSLAVALAHQLQAIPDLELPADLAQNEDPDFEALNENLKLMSDALDIDEEDLDDSPFKSFVEACVEKTNTRQQRETRARWCLRALREDLSEL
jgi:hypothetical protein